MQVMTIFEDIRELLLPRSCVMCGERLSKYEHWLCCNCLRRLDLVKIVDVEDNPIQRLFLGQIPIERAASYFFHEGEKTRTLLHRLKYFDQPDIGVYLAHLMAEDLVKKNFFDGIDVLIPMPLHWKRLWKRGYNQSRYICQGIREVTDIPIDSGIVERIVNNPTQTHLYTTERKTNVEGIFRLKHPERIKGRHVLLVDDVITTGATTMECAKELMTAGDIRISIVSLSYAGQRFIQTANDLK